LVRTADGLHLWSKTYDRELKDIFAVQEDIATAVADELKITFGIDRSYKQLGGTNNLEAYEHYLVSKGRYIDGEFSRALESINAAIALDPGFAVAWALKGMVHWFLSGNIYADRVSLELDSGLNAALKAIELEPNLGKAYLTLGSIHIRRGEFIEAEKYFRKGMELTTESIDYVEYGLPMLYAFVGYIRKCNELFEEALRNDPIRPFLRAAYIEGLGILGDMERAEEEYERGKAIFGDQWFSGDLYITMVRLGAKDVLSIDKIPEVPYLAPPIHGLIWAMGREHVDSPEEGLAELHRLFSSEDNLDTGSLSFMACWAAYFGDPEFAMDAMEKGINIEASGLIDYWLPVFHEVRQLPRFKEYVREIGLVDYWNEFGWPDLCRPVGDDDFECD